MDMSIDELGAIMVGEFKRIAEQFTLVFERFDRIEIRLARVEEIVEDHTGRFIAIEDRLSKVEYRCDETDRKIGVLQGQMNDVQSKVSNIEHILEEAPPKKLKKRIAKLEKHTFGGLQPA